MKARKKPVVVDVLHYQNVSDKCAIDFCDGKAAVIAYGCLVIYTLEGNMRVSPGDYIIKGVEGEFYPCKPDIFHKTYDIL